MKERRFATITRKELVEEIRKLGHTEINERKIEDLQMNDLLPPFDIHGRARSRGEGREASAWSQGHRVIEQAVCICELLRAHKTFERLYIPLRMRGFPIPIKRLRETLAKPLHKTAHAFGSAESSHDENGKVLSIEDMISDAADTVSQRLIKKLENIGIDMPQAVQEAAEVILNIYFNEDFRLNGRRLKATVEER